VGQERRGNEKGNIGANHEYVAVREVDQQKNPINQSVAQGDEGVETSPLQGIDDILDYKFHALRSGGALLSRFPIITGQAPLLGRALPAMMVVGQITGRRIPRR
jgi:hypothetical protein